jgi:hypothetical protein
MPGSNQIKTHARQSGGDDITRKRKLREKERRETREHTEPQAEEKGYSSHEPIQPMEHPKEEFTKRRTHYSIIKEQGSYRPLERYS